MSWPLLSSSQIITRSAALAVRDLLDEFAVDVDESEGVDVDNNNIMVVDDEEGRPPSSSTLALSTSSSSELVNKWPERAPTNVSDAAAAVNVFCEISEQLLVSWWFCPVCDEDKDPDAITDEAYMFVADVVSAWHEGFGGNVRPHDFVMVDCCPCRAYNALSVPLQELAYALPS
jgi:hypothetical protein